MDKIADQEGSPLEIFKDRVIRPFYILEDVSSPRAGHSELTLDLARSTIGYRRAEELTVRITDVGLGSDQSLGYRHWTSDPVLRGARSSAAIDTMRNVESQDTAQLVVND